jgi:tetratricopeptide (TPR) repeat protein
MMKLRTVVLIFLMAGSFAWTQNMENAGIDYTTALQKKGDQRIAAFEAYIKNYPDPAQNVFTKLAYYWLTVDNYSSKNYDKAIRNGEKAIALGGLEAKLEAGLYLMLGSSFGVKSFSGYSQEKALKWAEKAIDFSQKNDVGDIAKQAQALKNELTGVAKQPAKPLTSLEKIGLLYNQKKYEEAISLFNSFGETDKSDETIFEIYARSLMNANKLDAAVKEFTDAYAKNRKAINAERLGNIFLAKAKKDKKFYDQAINYYIEAGLLYKNEKNTPRQDALLKNAQYWLFEKYDYNAKIKKYNATVKPVKPVVSNEKEIKKLERDLDKLQRQLDETYGDVEMPGYEQDKLDKIQQQIDKLRAGNKKPADDPNAAAAEALMKEQKRIEAEFKTLSDQAKKKLGL